MKVYNSIPRDAYFAIADEARAIGIPFAGHVPEAVSTGEASDAGQLSEEHLINILLDCSTNADDLRAARIAAMTSDKITGEARLRLLAWPEPEGLFDTYSEQKAAQLFAKFVQNGTWQTPTLVVLSGFARARDHEFVHDPRRRFLPKQWTDSWDPRVTFYLRDLSPENYDLLHARIVSLLERYKKLVGKCARRVSNFSPVPIRAAGTLCFPASACMKNWRFWSNPVSRRWRRCNRQRAIPRDTSTSRVKWERSR